MPGGKRSPQSCERGLIELKWLRQIDISEQIGDGKARQAVTLDDAIIVAMRLADAQ